MVYSITVTEVVVAGLGLSLACLVIGNLLALLERIHLCGYLERESLERLPAMQAYQWEWWDGYLKDMTFQETQYKKKDGFVTEWQID